MNDARAASPLRRMLYLGPPERFEALAGQLAITTEQAEQALARGAFRLLLPVSDTEGGAVFEVERAATVDIAVERIDADCFDLVLLDARPRPGEPRRWFSDTAAAELCDRLANEPNPLRRYRSARVLAILPEAPNTGSETYLVGRHRLGGFLVSPFSREQFFETLARLLILRATGKTALCVTGTGMESVLFAAGAVEALDEELAPRRMHGCELFIGNSSASLVAALVAQGVTGHELANVLAGRSGRLSRFDRRALTPSALGEAVELGGKLAKALLRPRFLQRDALDAVATAVPVGLSSNKALEDWLRTELAKPGLTDDLRELAGRLYIGATDLDRFTPSVFGEPGLMQVSVASAVAASGAFLPVFAPVRVNGRDYIDGLFTRTAHVELAVRKGATLVFVIQPHTPAAVTQGATPMRRRGGLDVAWQAFKALVHSRFMQAMERMIEQYPHVEFVVVKPDPALAEKLPRPSLSATLPLHVMEAGALTARDALADFRQHRATSLTRHGWRGR